MSRPSKKQRLRMAKQRRTERERRKNTGRIREEHIETARQRHARLQAEKETKRIEARRAEHQIPEGRMWSMVDGRMRHTTALCQELRAAGIPHFRAQDEIEQILPSGRKRKIRVPLVARTVLVAAREDRGPQTVARVDEAGQRTVVEHADRLNAEDYYAIQGLSRHIARVHLQPGHELPRTVPEADVIRFAETLIGSRPIYDLNGRPYNPGDDVQVVDGPFSSFPGKIEEVDDETGVLKVGVFIFGRRTPVELTPQQVVHA